MSRQISCNTRFGQTNARTVFTTKCVALGELLFMQDASKVGQQIKGQIGTKAESYQNAKFLTHVIKYVYKTKDTVSSKLYSKSEGVVKF